MWRVFGAFIFNFELFLTECLDGWFIIHYLISEMSIWQYIFYYNELLFLVYTDVIIETVFHPNTHWSSSGINYLTLYGISDVYCDISYTARLCWIRVPLPDPRIELTTIGQILSIITSTSRGKNIDAPIESRFLYFY